jgi:hypothetical protein
MAATDVLKSFRDSGYAAKDPAKDPAKPGDGEETKTRIINLTDDEQKSFAGSKPGESLTCTVTGTLEEGGQFHVMSVAPPDGAAGYGNEQNMAGQVAQRVMPSIMPSPS